jgi:hypothetical protein
LEAAEAIKEEEKKGEKGVWRKGEGEENRRIKPSDLPPLCCCVVDVIRVRTKSFAPVKLKNK